MTEFTMPFVLFVIAAFIFGLLIGSFLNVVIHRIPLGESVVFPGSHCTNCGAAVRPMDNIPVLSFLLLKGRCRNCGDSISWRYPTVELLTAILFAFIAYKTGMTWEAGLEMIFAAVMIALIFIDALHHLLPNVITYPAIVFALAAATARAGWGEPISYSFDLSFVFVTENQSFHVVRSAIVGGLLFALAAPGFWLLDWLDLRLYNKYFEWEDMNAEPETGTDVTDANSPNTEDAGSANPVTNLDAEEEAERRYRRTIFASMIFGLVVGVVWAALVLLLGSKHPEMFDSALGGLWRAVIAALIGSMPIWWLRAAYFYIRGAEGMGLGDVKLMAIIGAFLGWQGAFGVLLMGSIGGAVIGVILAWRSQRGMKTALPFGVCLGAAALLVLLTPIFRWYLSL